MAVEEFPTRRQAPGIASLAEKVSRMDQVLHGTIDEPETGVINRVKSLEKDRDRVVNRVNLWGGIFLGVLAAEGFANGAMAHVIASVITAVTGVK